jgi:hypothetical protein
VEAVDQGGGGDSRGGGGPGWAKEDLWHQTSVGGVRGRSASGGGVAEDGRWRRTRKCGGWGGGREAGLGHAVFCGRERRGLACMHFFPKSRNFHRWLLEPTEDINFRRPSLKPTEVKISSVGQPGPMKVLCFLSGFSKTNVSSLGRQKYVFFPVVELKDRKRGPEGGG